MNSFGGTRVEIQGTCCMLADPQENLSAYTFETPRIRFRDVFPDGFLSVEASSSNNGLSVCEVLRTRLQLSQGRLCHFRECAPSSHPGLAVCAYQKHPHLS